MGLGLGQGLALGLRLGPQVLRESPGFRLEVLRLPLGLLLDLQRLYPATFGVGIDNLEQMSGDPQHCFRERC